jgi:signal transduction histidine kinase
VFGLGVVFAFGALRQAFLLYAGELPAWQTGAAAFGEVALAGLALGGLGALRALQRTTRERDRAEDLHWDSMEAVRVMSELASRPGAGLEEKLGTVLELGTSRFALDLGVAWLDDGSPEGRVFAVRAPRLDPERRDACLAGLVPRLRDASRGSRPLLLLDRDAASEDVPAHPATFFGVAVSSAGTVHGALAFVGLSRAESRFTATDKDLLGLMAQWLAAELDRSARPADRPADAAPTLARVARESFRAQRSVDLNRSIARLESRLRQRVGADGTLSLDLAPGLPPLARGRLTAPRLVEGLVDAAARLAPTGRIELSTRPPADASREATLCVCVRGSGIDVDALRRIFDPSPEPGEDVSRSALPLAGIERLLRIDGGDLSVSIEPQRRALLTAWLPVAERARAPAQPSRSGAQAPASERL